MIYIGFADNLHHILFPIGSGACMLLALGIYMLSVKLMHNRSYLDDCT